MIVDEDLPRSFPSNVLYSNGRSPAVIMPRNISMVPRRPNILQIHRLQPRHYPVIVRQSPAMFQRNSSNIFRPRILVPPRFYQVRHLTPNVPKKGMTRMPYTLRTQGIKPYVHRQRYPHANVPRKPLFAPTRVSSNVRQLLHTKTYMAYLENLDDESSISKWDKAVRFGGRENYIE